MLEFKIIKHPDQLKEKLNYFDPLQSTWIVSDLKSKQDLQNMCLQKNGFFSDESILRISDFWKMWLRRLAPQIKIVSDDFIQILVIKFIDQYGTSLDLKKNDAKTLFHYVTELAPLLLHKPSQDSLKEWIFEKDPKPLWIEWEIKAQACVNYILQEHLCLSSHWIVSYLQSLNLENVVWGRNLIIDLGSQMTSLEMGVLNLLSKKNKIEIIVPDPDWKNKFGFILRTYTDYIGYVKYEQLKTTSYKTEIHPENFFRFNTEANEVKFITQQVRSWIERGVNPDQIALLSPRLEDYWPVLKIHLDAEGIPTQKDSVSKLMSTGIVQRWLSLSMAQTEDIRWSHLELSYAALFDHTNSDSPLMQDENFIKYEKFKSQFFELIDQSDLQKSPSLQQVCFEQVKLNHFLSRNKFLAHMMIVWLQIDPYLKFNQLLQNIIKDFIQNTIHIELAFSDWMNVLKSRLSKTEVKTYENFKNGVSVLPLNSARTLNLTHKIWFGLDEDGLVGKQNRVLPLEDIAELKRTFDLALDYPEESYADFNLRWYSMCDVSEQFFTCSHVSVKAEPLNISSFFLEHNKHPVQPEIKHTVLDSEQHYFNPQSDTQKLVKLELEKKDNVISVQSLKIKSLSPSDLETYDACSFKFLARKGFKLLSIDNEGYEIENRQRGNIIHDLFQYLIADDKYLKITSDEISRKLDELRTANELFKNLDIFWKPQKDKLLKTAIQFIEIEKNRLHCVKSLKHSVELPFEIFFDLEKIEFTESKPSGRNFLIKGRLDRLDLALEHKQALIFDYKSSKSDSTTYSGKWLETSQFQLLFYAIAVEKVFNVKVVGALYYYYKNFKHNYGFLNKEHNSFTESVHYQKNTLQSDEQIQELFQEFNQKVLEILTKIENLEFKVQPSKIKNCDKCEWDKTCRIKNRN